MDFKNLIDNARDQKAAAEAAEKQKLEDEQNARNAKLEAGIALLDEHVRPLLEQAVEALKAENIQASIEDRFTRNAYAYSAPSLVLKPMGPKRPSDNYQYRARAMHFVAEDRGSLTISAGDAYGDKPEKYVTTAQKTEQIPAAVEKAFGVLMANYLADADGWSRTMGA